MKPTRASFIVLLVLIQSLNLVAQVKPNYQFKVSANIHTNSNYIGNGRYNHNNGGGNIYLQNIGCVRLASDSLKMQEIGLVNTNYITLARIDNIQQDKINRFIGVHNSLGLVYVRRRKLEYWSHQSEFNLQGYLAHLFNNQGKKSFYKSYVYSGFGIMQTAFFSLTNTTEIGPFVGVNFDLLNQGYKDVVVPKGFVSDNVLSMDWRIGIAVNL